MTDKKDSSRPSALSHESIEKELVRLEDERRKGLQELQSLESTLQATRAQLLRIDGSITTLRALIAEST